MLLYLIWDNKSIEKPCHKSDKFLFYSTRRYKIYVYVYMSMYIVQYTVYIKCLSGFK